MQKGEALINTAIVPKRGYGDSMTARKTTQDKSRLRSPSPGGQVVQVPDFGYLDLPLTTEKVLPDRLIMFVDLFGAFDTANSGDVRYVISLKGLEGRFQIQFDCQSWGTVRPWMFFSACDSE